MGVFDKWFSRAKYRAAFWFGGHGVAFDRAAYEHETVRAIIDCIAAHTAKAEALHVIVDANGRIKEIKRNSPYTKLLNQQPNEIMTGYDLKYKLISHVENHTTAMVYVKWQGMQPLAFYPINYQQYEFIKLTDGSWAVEFTDTTGQEYTLPLEDVIVLRKFYNARDVGGDGNDAIYNTLDMIKTAEQGMADALHVSNKIRGLLKQKNARLNAEDAQTSAETFAANMRKAAGEGGVVGIDLTEEYVPLNANAYSLNAMQMREIRNGLLRYWRTSENILKSDYTEGQWLAWYESVIEPRLIQMGQAFTNACFTQTEKNHGNRIIFFSSTLMHTSIQTKINILTASKEVGLFSANELRELFGYAPVEGGDVWQVSLNYVNKNKQDVYQGVTGEEEDHAEADTDTGEEAESDAGEAV